MILAPHLVAVLLEDIKRDFVAAFGPYFRNGYYAHSVEQLYDSLVRLNPGQFKRMPLEQAMDALIAQGNTFIVGGKGQLKVLSRSPHLELSPDFVRTLETHMGLTSEYSTAGYAAHYGASFTNYPLTKLFDVAPKHEPVEFEPDITGMGEALEEKIGAKKFAYQVEQWHKYTAGSLAAHYARILGQPISAGDMELLAARFGHVLKKSA